MVSFATYEIESDLKSQDHSYIVGVDEAGRGCEHPSAEILTNNGWKFYNTLLPNDKVLSYTDEGTIVWQAIHDVVVKTFEGSILDFSNRSVHISVTSDHYFDVLRRTFKRDKLDGNKLKITGYKFRGRKSVLDLVANDYIPRGGRWESKDKKYFILPTTLKNKWDHSGKIYLEKAIDMDVWLAFLGIYLAEGSASYSKGNAYTVVISQKKQKTFKEIYNLCKKLPFEVFKCPIGIVIRNKQLYDYLKPLGDCYTKYIPKEFKELSSRQLNILISWMIKGDGSCYTGENRKEVCTYYTTSVKLKDDFEEILLKAGWTYKTTTREPRDGEIAGRKILKENCVPCFETRLRRNNKIHVKSLHKKEIFYKGKVFCLSLLKYHNFYVRRSGSGYFTGNCLSGPVVASAVHVPDDMIFELLHKVTDSKKLTAKKREELFPLIKNNCDIGIGVVSSKIIDEINILNATKLAMEEALSYFVNPIPDYVLIDGTVKLDNLPIQQEQVIRGDSKSISIAAASIIAKVVRDRIMDDLHDIWSFYGWNKNRGYGTKYHTEAIEIYGPCEVHRMTFKKVREWV